MEVFLKQLNFIFPYCFLRERGKVGKRGQASKMWVGIHHSMQFEYYVAEKNNLNNKILSRLDSLMRVGNLTLERKQKAQEENPIRYWTVILQIH